MIRVNCLHKPCTVCAMISVERCAFVRSNALQRQRALVLSRGVRCKGAESDNTDGNQHCHHRAQGFGADVFHKSAFTGGPHHCQGRRQNGYRYTRLWIGQPKAAPLSKRTPFPRHQRGLIERIRRNETTGYEGTRVLLRRKLFWRE